LENKILEMEAADAEDTLRGTTAAIVKDAFE
jgi:hypothetical protein